MKKKKLITAGMLVIALVFGLFMAGCEEEGLLPSA